MTADDWVKIIAAIGVTVGAILTGLGAVLAQTRANFRAINGRMTELLETTRKLAELEARQAAARRRRRTSSVFNPKDPKI